ncbi:MAG: hypothetical protein MI921_23905 [Cytophagales bacterium]|nr:hypothetical protein [Cytophagales bacterium]
MKINIIFTTVMLSIVTFTNAQIQEVSPPSTNTAALGKSNATALFNLGYDGRNDLSGGRYLDNLQIKNNGNEETVKRFTFDYTYMSSDNYCEEAKSVCDNHCPPGIQECFDECYNIYQSCAGLADDGNFHDKYRMFLSAVYETEAGVDDLCYCEKRLESCNSQCPNVQECFDECYVAFQSCEITNQSGTDCSQVVLSKLPAYQFSYNSLSLPPRLSKQQDFWGYYNANAENSLIPRVYVYPAYNEIRKKYSYLPRDNYQGNSYLMNGANRRANPPFAQAGILTKITYPTGGSSTYGYKSNEYYDIDIQKNIQGGGLRIEQITLFDGIDHGNDIVKNYSYNKYSDSSQSSGVLVNYPSFVSVALIERESVSKVDHPFKENIIYNRYDHAGNICEYRQANGIPVSMIWGYNKQYPITKIENATYDDVANSL